MTPDLPPGYKAITEYEGPVPEGWPDGPVAIRMNCRLGPNVAPAVMAFCAVCGDAVWRSLAAVDDMPSVCLLCALRLPGMAPP